VPLDDDDHVLVFADSYRSVASAAIVRVFPRADEVVAEREDF